jgi:hypothetical protein
VRYFTEYTQTAMACSGMENVPEAERVVIDADQVPVETLIEFAHGSHVAEAFACYTSPDIEV